MGQPYGRPVDYGSEECGIIDNNDIASYFDSGEFLKHVFGSDILEVGNALGGSRMPRDTSHVEILSLRGKMGVRLKKVMPDDC